MDADTPSSGTQTASERHRPEPPERSRVPASVHAPAIESVATDAARDDPAFTRRSRLLHEAYELAAEAHAGQHEESDGSPYIDHPVGVARLLFEAGYDDTVVAAGLVHDAVEKTDVTNDQIADRLGRPVADLVAALTEPSGPASFAHRKAALRAQVEHAGDDAAAVFAADKVAKTSGLRAAVARLGVAEVGRRLSHPLDAKLDNYRAALELLRASRRSAPFLPRLASELSELSLYATHDAAFSVARHAVHAINARDGDALAALCDPDVQWWPALILAAAGDPYHGHDGVRRYIRDIDAAWSRFAIAIRDVRSVGDRLLAICRVDARARTGGRAIAELSAVVYWLRDGRLLGACTYPGLGATLAPAV